MLSRNSSANYSGQLETYFYFCVLFRTKVTIETKGNKSFFLEQKLQIGIKGNKSLLFAFISIVTFVLKKLLF
jgi:hypothetical protein